MVAGTTHARMTSSQKQEVRARHRAHPTMTQHELGEWAVAAFRLSRAPSRTTVYRVLVAKDDDKANPEQKRCQPVLSPALEVTLLKWIRDCERYNIPIVAAPSAATELSLLTFSTGWMCKFQKRHKLTSKRAYGEAASTKAVSVEGERATLQVITQGYTKRDIYNTDETAYFYCTPPNKFISMKRISGRENAKKQLTAVVTCNADDSPKLPLLFVGAARRPCCFGGKSGEQLDFEYKSAPKGWINTERFQIWARGFNDCMRAENRKVLLLLNNASSHHLAELLSNVTLQTLPSNMTTHLQPQDAGITQAFKERIAQ